MSSDSGFQPMRADDFRRIHWRDTTANEGRKALVEAWNNIFLCCWHPTGWQEWQVTYLMTHTFGCKCVRKVLRNAVWCFKKPLGVPTGMVGPSFATVFLGLRSRWFKWFDHSTQLTVSKPHSVHNDQTTWKMVIIHTPAIDWTMIHSDVRFCHLKT